MNGSLNSIVGGLAAVAVAAMSVALGVNLLPSRATVEESGTLVPWFVAWGMVIGTTLVALVLAGYLVRSGMSESRAGDPKRDGAHV